MNLTKGKISKLYNKKKQSLRKRRRVKKHDKQTFRKRPFNLANKTIRKNGGGGPFDNILGMSKYKKVEGDDGQRPSVFELPNIHKKSPNGEGISVEENPIPVKKEKTVKSPLHANTEDTQITSNNALSQQSEKPSYGERFKNFFNRSKAPSSTQPEAQSSTQSNNSDDSYDLLGLGDMLNPNEETTIESERNRNKTREFNNSNEKPKIIDDLGDIAYKQKRQEFNNFPKNDTSSSSGNFENAFFVPTTIVSKSTSDQSKTSDSTSTSDQSKASDFTPTSAQSTEPEVADQSKEQVAEEKNPAHSKIPEQNEAQQVSSTTSNSNPSSSPSDKRQNMKDSFMVVMDGLADMVAEKVAQRIPAAREGLQNGFDGVLAVTDALNPTGARTKTGASEALSGETDASGATGKSEESPSEATGASEETLKGETDESEATDPNLETSTASSNTGLTISKEEFERYIPAIDTTTDNQEKENIIKLSSEINKNPSYTEKDAQALINSSGLSDPLKKEIMEKINTYFEEANKEKFFDANSGPPENIKSPSPIPSPNYTFTISWDNLLNRIAPTEELQNKIVHNNVQKTSYSLEEALNLVKSSDLSEQEKAAAIEKLNKYFGVVINGKGARPVENVPSAAAASGVTGANKVTGASGENVPSAETPSAVTDPNAAAASGVTANGDTNSNTPSIAETPIITSEINNINTHIPFSTNTNPNAAVDSNQNTSANADTSAALSPAPAPSAATGLSTVNNIIKENQHQNQPQNQPQTEKKNNDPSDENERLREWSYRAPGGQSKHKRTRRRRKKH